MDNGKNGNPAFSGKYLQIKIGLTPMSRFHRKMRPNMCYYININTLPVLLAQGRVMTETETKMERIIDEKEFKWYLPASNQLLGLCVAALPGLGGGGSTTEYISLPPYNYYYFKSASDGKFGNSDRTTGSDRCVR